MELPQYRSHKVVGAAKIIAIDNDARVTLDGVDTPHYVGHQWLEEKHAEVGGYFVQYEDGYCSYSPAKAFEEGYTRV